MEREARDSTLPRREFQGLATRKLLGDLAAAEAGHKLPPVTRRRHLDPAARRVEDLAWRRQLILTWIHLGLLA